MKPQNQLKLPFLDRRVVKPAQLQEIKSRIFPNIYKLPWHLPVIITVYIIPNNGLPDVLVSSCPISVWAQTAHLTLMADSLHANMEAVILHSQQMFRIYSVLEHWLIFSIPKTVIEIE